MATKRVKERVPKELVVTISRTIQVKSYEPVTITVTEKHELEEGESAKGVRLQVYNQVGSAVARFMDHEIARYTEEEQD